MARLSLKEMTASAQLWSAPASAMPVLVTLVYLHMKGACVSLLWGLLILVCAVLLHYIWNILHTPRRRAKKYIAFGPMDLLAILFLGVLLPMGISYLITENLDWSVLSVSVPVGMISAGVFHATSTREILSKNAEAWTDTAEMVDAWIFALEMIVPFAWIGICSVIGLLPMLTVISFLSIALALGCATTMLKSIGQGTTLIDDLDERTSTFQLIFSVLLTVSLILGM